MASETEALKKDMDELRASINKLSKDVSSISQSLAEDVKARARSTAEDIRRGAQTAASEVTAKGKESAEAVERTVRERPFQSLLIAFGAGLVLSQFLRKR